MRSNLMAGMALALLVAAPLAFSDQFREKMREPAAAPFTKRIGFRSDGVLISIQEKADVYQGDVRQVRQADVLQKGVVQQGDVLQKGGIRQRDVGYADIQQRRLGSVVPEGASVSHTDILLGFYASQRDEAAMLVAQAEKFRQLNHENVAQALVRMADDHRSLAARTSDLLRDRLATDIELAPRPQAPFISDNPAEMLDHDIRMHERALRRTQEHMAMVRLDAARALLEEASRATREHLATLQQLRAGFPGGALRLQDADDRDFNGRIRGNRVYGRVGQTAQAQVEQFEPKGKEKAPPFVPQLESRPNILEGEEVVIVPPAPPITVPQPPQVSVQPVQPPPEVPAAPPLPPPQPEQPAH